MTRKKPSNFDEAIAECEEAERLGITNLEDFYKPKVIAAHLGEFLSKKFSERDLIIQPCLPKQGLIPDPSLESRHYLY